MFARNQDIRILTLRFQARRKDDATTGAGFANVGAGRVTRWGAGAAFGIGI